MRSVALLALLVAIASGSSISSQPLTAPTGGAAFGIPLGGSSLSTMDTVTNGAGKTYTYTLGNSDLGKNLYFRTTLYACSTSGSWPLQTKVTGNDGTDSTIPYHNGDFTITSPAGVALAAVDANDDFTWYTSSITNATVMIATGGDSSAVANGKTFTYTVALGATAPTGSCLFFSDLISYGKPIGGNAVGADGNPGATQDAWIPCCDSVQSAYQVIMTDMPHKYLEVAATTVDGGFTKLGLTNPGSFFGLVDTTSFPSATHTGSVTARTCLTNQSCEIKAANYFVELTTNGYAYGAADAKDFHATFTLTTKAGVATASASIALVVAALFALFH